MGHLAVDEDRCENYDVLCDVLCNVNIVFVSDKQYIELYYTGIFIANGLTSVQTRTLIKILGVCGGGGGARGRAVFVYKHICDYFLQQFCLV